MGHLNISFGYYSKHLLFLHYFDPKRKYIHAKKTKQKRVLKRSFVFRFSFFFGQNIAILSIISIQNAKQKLKNYNRSKHEILRLH